MKDNQDKLNQNEITKKLILEQFVQNGLMEQFKSQIKSKVINLLSNQNKDLKEKIEFDYQTPFNRINKSKELILCVHLIKDFLECFDMKYTLPIFESETNIKDKISRDLIISDFKLPKEDEKVPLLLQIINKFGGDMDKKRSESVSQKLDESYGTKNNRFMVDIHVNKSDEEIVLSKSVIGGIGNSSSGGANVGTVPIKQKLPPMSFGGNNNNNAGGASNNYLNTSIGSNNSQSNKFNNTNISDVYLKENEEPVAKHNIEFKSANINDYNVNSNNNFNGNNNNNNKYDDEFNEVILEEFDDNNPNNKKKDERISGLEDSKSFSALNSLSMTPGYDISVSSYNLEKYDHVEDVHA